MAKHDYDEVTANEATGFSGFGGHLLTQSSAGGDDSKTRAVAAFGESGDEFVGTLSAYGIEDAEQVVAIAAIPEVREELQFSLGMKDKNFKALIEQAQSLLPTERAALVGSPAPKEFGLGVLVPPAETIQAAEMSAIAFGVEDKAAAVTLPASVNLIAFMPPIRSQAARGTCVSFTLTALNEYILRRRNIVRDLSEQHLYYETKLIDGSPGGCGTWQTKAVIALQSRGQCREQVWAYNPNLPCNNHGTIPSQAQPDGLSYRLAAIAVPARNALAYKTQMSLQRPVTVSIPVYDSWYQSAETRRSGRITMRLGNEPSVGGHAVCLVGYQDNPNSPGGGFFIVRNSWNTVWASQSPYGAGYGTIPYKYITDDAWEAFTAAVPGITGDSETSDDTAVPGKETVTIEVGSNIKISISAD